MARSNLGGLLAIIAGLVAVGVTIWSIVPQATVTTAGPVWRLAAFAAGVGFLVSAFLADARPGWSKVILVAGALVLATSAVVFGGLLSGGWAGYAVLIDLLPAVLALVAAVLIGPRQLSAGEQPGRRMAQVRDLPDRKPR